MELTLTSTIALISSIIYIILLWISIVRIDTQVDQKLKYWLMGVMVVAALTGLSFLLENGDPIVGEITRGGLEIIGLGLTMVLIGGLTFVYLQRK
ncbi:MAG: hypothetical protein K8I82_22225, partial [Anaerolineae bacterium]|nr:hypothetical protein [Anaerolineae bacterium]